MSTGLVGPGRLALCVATVIPFVSFAALPRAADAHPLHTTLTEIRLDRPRHTLHVVIRVFADDLEKAVTRHRRAVRGPVDADAAALAYLQSTFTLTDRSGRPLPLRPCGTRRSADLVWVCVEADAPADVMAVQLRNAILCDVYDDQVNIARSLVNGAPRSLLFVRGDRAKPLG